MKFKKILLAISLLTQPVFAKSTTQAVTPSTDSFKVVSGEKVSFSLVYTASDSSLTGVGISLVYDASKIKFAGFNNIKQDSLLAADKASKVDDDDKDGNNQTNAIVSMAWMDLKGTWPGEGKLPITLGVANFNVLSNKNSTTTINIIGDGAAQSILTTKPVSIIIGESTLMVNENTILDPVSTSESDIPKNIEIEETTDATVKSPVTNNIENSEKNQSGGGSFSWLFLIFLLPILRSKR